MIAIRTLARWQLSLIGVVGGSALMFSPLAFNGLFSPGFSGPRVLALTLSAVAAVTWALYFSWLNFRRADEFHREGMKFGWLWGGTIGLCASAPVYVFIGLGGLHWLDPNRPLSALAARAFVMGYSLPILSGVIGYLAVYAWWRLSKR